MKIRRLISCLVWALTFWLSTVLGAASASNDDAAQQKLLQDGRQVLAAGDPQSAITNYFDKVIATFEQRYPASGKEVYAARTSTESLLYLADAARRNVNAITVGSVWAYAYHLKGYALVELHRNAEAKIALEKSVRMAPQNARFLEELGSLYQREKDWPKALEIYERAEEAASGFSPPAEKDADSARAWRGLGYVYVELGRLTDAEAMYKKCLELNKADAVAAKELQYVKGLQAKQGQH